MCVHVLLVGYDLMESLLVVGVQKNVLTPQSMVVDSAVHCGWRVTNSSFFPSKQ